MHTYVFGIGWALIKLVPFALFLKRSSYGGGQL